MRARPLCTPLRRAAIIIAIALIAAFVPLTVTNASAAPGPTVFIGDASVHEGDSGGNRTLKLPVTLSEPATSEVVVSYVVSDGTATAGIDHKDFKGKTKTLKFKPNKKTGRTPTTKYVSIPVFADTVDEGDETVHVTITGVTGGYQVGDATGTGTIVDDDPGAGLRLAIGDSTAYEGDTGDKPNTGQLWVTLSDPAPADLTFDVTITGGSAKLDDDFVAKPTKRLTLKQGKWKKAFTIKVLADTVPEGDETIAVSISTSAPGVTVTDATGVATIADDDEPSGPDEFAISIGDVVSDGVPGVGAGNLESPDAQDIYTFEGTAGQRLFFDVLTDPCAVNDIQATLTGPTAAPVFTERTLSCGTSVFGDFGPFTLAETGTYTLVVDTGDGSTGTYSFRFAEVPDVDEFSISLGQVVSDGVPSSGAGKIEAAGLRDRYTFEATAGQTLYFDVLTECGIQGLDATLTAPGGTAVFTNRSLDCGTSAFADFGPFTVGQTGTFTLVVGGLGTNDDSTGTYSFVVRVVPAADQFTIAVGDVVSDGIPGAGAGNIEEPGARDVYTFEATTGQRLFFDVLTTCGIQGLDATLTAPGGMAVFTNRGVDCDSSTFNDFGPFDVPVGGTYTLTVGGLGSNDDSTGAYSFVVRAVPAADEFAIALGDVVSNGVPASGAGNIEAPGARDVYTFEATAGQMLLFDVLTPCSVQGLDATLTDANGAAVFTNRSVDCGTSAFNDFGPFAVTASGTYTLTVGGLGANEDTTGTYSFQFVLT